MSQVYLVGRPNVGKSYLFNRLTGADQKVANFSGVTTNKKTHVHTHSDIEIIDLPGLYSLIPKSSDEEVALKTITDSAPDDLILLVIDSLKFSSQIDFIIKLRSWCLKKRKPLALCLNMSDEIQKANVKLDKPNIEKTLELPVFETSAKTKEGIEVLSNFISKKTWSAPEALDTELDLTKKLLSFIDGKKNEILSFQNKIDSFLLSPYLGGIAFFLITYLIFQSIFTWATPFMDLVENTIGFLATKTSLSLNEGPLKSFIENGVFAGFGAFLVFTPQIFILTLIISFLEKSGYMARATVICHKPLSLFGLNGKSFIPLMTGHACAVPAIYAARSIENKWIRNLTIFVTPLTVCSARIPVYALLIRILIPDDRFFFGLLGLQGLAFFGMYFFGIFMALFVSAMANYFSKRKNEDDFIIELPKYRWPELNFLIQKSMATTWNFIKDAGPIIFILNAIIWTLSYFPYGTDNFSSSYMAKIGHFFEPLFQPMGLDWIQGVAILTSFVAREVFVSTLGLLYGLQSDNVDEILKLNQIQNISFASGVSLLFFFAIALQCMSTVAVIAKEVNSKLAYVSLLFYIVLAYLLSVTIYQLLTL